MPAFPFPNLLLECNIYTYDVTAPAWPGIPIAPPRSSGVACALVYGRRVNVASTGGTGIQGVPLTAMSLLLSKGFDIRGLENNIGQDMVEVPAGSGRWYGVYSVDDISKGYASEHRTATILATLGTWTAPYA
jgi:hypothetical protein